MTKKITSLLSALLMCFAALIACTPASASHLRGTSVSWSPTSVPGQVQFTIQYSQRTSFGGCSVSGCPDGSTIGVPFNFGDNATGTILTTVTSSNTAEDYFSSTGTILHTYGGVGPYLASYLICCRVSTIVSGHDQYLQMQTSVSPFAVPVNHSPVVSEPAIITLPLQNTTGFFISASDLDRDTLHYRLSTATEMYNAGGFSCAEQEPPGLSVNPSTGQVTWDTTQIVKAGCSYAAPKSGDLWTVQFMVEDLDALGKVKSKVPLDIILKFVSSVEAPPTIALSQPGPITVRVGQPITFTATGNDTAANSRVTLNVTGLPVGATSTNLNQALIPAVTSTFNWTPTSSQVGSYVITYSATNDTFEQVLTSITIYVQNPQPPVLTCSTSLTAQYNMPITIPLSFTDPQADAVTVKWSVDGTAYRTDNIPASNGTSTDSITQTFTTTGTHNVTVNATDTDNASSTCSTTVTVNPADQTISFSVPATLTYGDPSLALTATSTSGLPVTYSASGSCMIVNSMLKTTGAGTCTVTAMQAGNANYKPATSVVKTITVAPAVLQVTANNATKVYGTANPTFTDTLSGFVNGDTATSVTGAAANSTTATTTSLAGTYPITPSVGTLASANYTFAFVSRALVVTAAPQAITFTLPAAGSTNTTITLNGTGGASGNPVTYAVTGPATVVGNKLTITGAGTITVTASQAGNANYSAAPPVTMSFPTKVTASITLTASNTSLTYPNSTNVMPCVKLMNGMAATGTISIYDGTKLLSTQTVQGGGCFTYYIAPALNVGQHTLTAYYNDAKNTNVFSAPLVITVAPGATTAEVDCWGHNFAYGPDFKCDANPDSGPSSGYMTYSYDGGPLVSVPLNAAQHVLFTLPRPNVGTHTVVITYPAQGNYGAFTLPLQTFVVTAAPVNVALTPSAFYAKVGTAVSASVALSSYSAGVPAGIGTVSFYDGAKLLGTSPVDASGKAKLSLGALPIGTHVVTANYSGSSNFATGSSNVTIQIGKY